MYVLIEDISYDNNKIQKTKNIVIFPFDNLKNC